MPHRLHEVVGQLLATGVPPGCTLVKEPACQGDQRVPLFCSDEKATATRICNVDSLVLCGGKIRLIVEIEESNVKPTQIAGKFLTSALASHSIHSRHGGEAIPKGDRVASLQFLDTSKLPSVTGKQRQWGIIGAGIRSFLPLGGITEYKLFCGCEADFLGDIGRQIIQDVQQACHP